MTAGQVEVEAVVPYLGGEKCLLGLDVEKKGVEHILEALTNEEKSEMPDPGMPIRHLRAEKGDIYKAIEKLRAALQWRKEFDVANLCNASSEEGHEKYRELLKRENATGKIYVRGYDKHGRAYIYMRSTRENTHTLEDNMKHLVWNLEKAIACTKKRSMELGATVPLEKVNLIIDYDGFSLAKAPPMNVSRYTLDILQKHYPERMYRCYAMNPPFMFQAFWSIIRPFVDPVTKEKVVFCSGKTGAQQLSLHAENQNKLEPVAGGTCSVPFVSQTYLKLPFEESFDE